MTEDLTQYQTQMIIPEKAVPFFEKALDPYAVALMASLIETGENKNKWKMEAFFDGKPDKHTLDVTIAIAAMSAEIDEPKWDLLPVPKKNWLRENLMNFPPFEFGRYYIYGSHIENPEIPDGKVALQIDAATAFGSGEHATTQGCLQAFEDVLKKTQPKTILDMGCGSGILSMAAAKILGDKVKIDAVDIDPESVRVTKENICINGVEKNIKVFQSTGYEKITEQYDLIFANILARPLMDMAPDLYQHLKVGGMAILSGFLNGQRSWVLKAHEKVGLEFVQAYKIKEWSTAIVKRN